MINIAIIDQNETFRESLKTLLEQISDFRVVVDTDDGNFLKTPNTVPIQVLLIDNSIGKEKCNEFIQNTMLKSKSVKSLILTMYREDLVFCADRTDIILKNSSKKDFENRIKNLINS